jgi:hypothetical protein
MKRCLQFVALSIVVLLAVPPALARELCLPVQGMAGDACCASTSNSASRLTGLKGSTRVAQVDNGCGEGCCSISSPSAPSQNAPERAKVEVAQAAVLASAGAILLPTYAAKPSPCELGHASAPALFLLHKVFRI